MNGCNISPNLYINFIVPFDQPLFDQQYQQQAKMILRSAELDLHIQAFVDDCLRKSVMPTTQG